MSLSENLGSIYTRLDMALSDVNSALIEKGGNRSNNIMNIGNRIREIEIGGADEIANDIIDGSITNIEIDDVSSIRSYAFCSCSRLTDVIISGDIHTIDSHAFDSCNRLVNVSMSDYVNYIREYAFYDCYRLENITLSSNLMYIGNNAFYNCNKITTLEIPNGVTSIGDSAFNHCDALTNITIPDSVTNIGSYAFCFCKNLETITIPNSVISLGDKVIDSTKFYNNSANWDGEVLYLGRHFYRAKNTLSGTYTIKNGTLSIGNSAFFGCQNLIGVIIPSGMLKISSDAFIACYKLASITIPDSVTIIGSDAFSSCNKLTDMYLRPVTPPTLGSTGAIPSNTIIHVPIGSGDAYKSATNWSTFADNIVEDISV